MMWLNGALVEEGTIEASSAGATLGWGVFRTLGISNGAPRFFQRHFERLRQDADAAQLEFSFSPETVFEALRQVLRANSVEEGLARLTLTQRGDGRWNTQNGADLSIFALESQGATAPARVQLSPYRTEAKRPLAGVKTTSYLPHFWAWRQAQQSGFDEAILRDGADFLSDGARSTLVWVRNGELFMPSLQTGCLRGIGRDLVVEWAASQSIPVNEGLFSRCCAEEADEAWLVSAATGARFIASWHDENGALQRDFALQRPLGSAFQVWWLRAGD